jgi:hypothetical protein
LQLLANILRDNHLKFGRELDDLHGRDLLTIIISIIFWYVNRLIDLQVVLHTDDQWEFHHTFALSIAQAKDIASWSH